MSSHPLEMQDVMAKKRQKCSARLKIVCFCSQLQVVIIVISRQKSSSAEMFQDPPGF